MTGSFAQRATYRVRQFGWAVASWWGKPEAAELARARGALPTQGWEIFSRMPAVDQKHALKVLQDLQKAGYDDPALAQAALLHDAAKRAGGVTLLHRVAVVLIKALAPERWQRLKTSAEPTPASPAYPLWAHANHPATGARLAAAAGCQPEAVDLILRHQDPLPPEGARSEQDLLLAALQKADDDN